MTPQEIFDGLCRPFATLDVMWRVGPTNEKRKKPDDPLKGQALCYVDARAVMDRLDSVVGPDCWMCNYTPGVGTSIVCNIAIRFPTYQKRPDGGDPVHVGHEWVWKGDGAGPSDMEADKGALSDAFKRAAVRWGVGRYLYDIRAPWVELETKGSMKVIPQATYERLDKLHDETARRIVGAKGTK